jgi:hypothetical protein
MKQIRQTKNLPLIPNKFDQTSRLKVDKIHECLEKFFLVKREIYLGGRQESLVMIRNIGVYVAIIIAKINRNIVMDSFKRDRTMFYHVTKVIDDWFGAEKFYKEELETLKSFLEFYIKETGKEPDGTPLYISRLEVIDRTGRAYTNMAVENMEFSFQDDNRTLKIFVK